MQGVLVGLGGSDAGEMLGKAEVFGHWGGHSGRCRMVWMEIRNSSIPTSMRVMGSSKHGVTQRRSFFTQCLTAGCCWGHREEESHRLPEAMPVSTAWLGCSCCLCIFPNASLPEGVGYSGERHSTGLKQCCGFGVLCREAVSCFSIY